MHTGVTVRICTQNTGQELYIQREQPCNNLDRQSLMNEANRNCVNRDITCERAISLNFSELYPTTPLMCDQSSDPPDDPPDDPLYSTTQCQPCPTCSEMEYTTTTDSPTSTTDYPTGQCPNVVTSNEPKSNTNSSQTNNLKVTNERNSLIISLGVLVGILVILLIVVTSGWVWTCWTMKRNKATTQEHVRYKKK